MLDDTLEKYGITPENIYGVDEIGFQTEGGKEQERVFGPWKHREPQYQQHKGNRDNITAIVGISAVGDAPPPTIIFKGAAYQVKWKQNNPANAL